MAEIATDTAEALYTAANYPSTRRMGQLELVLRDGTSALVYLRGTPAERKLLVLQVVEECWVNAYFAEPPGKERQCFDNWQPKPLGIPIGYPIIPSPLKVRKFLSKLLESVEKHNPPQLPPGFPRPSTL